MWDYGSVVPLGLEVRDAAGVLTNAATNTLTIRLPDGTSVTPTATNSSTGVYTCLYTTTQAGLHQWSWLTTVPSTGETGSFDVSAQFPGLILSLDEAKAALNIRSTDTAQDDELRDILEGVTAVIEDVVGAVARRTVTSTIYPTVYSCEYKLPVSPVVSITSAALVRDASAQTVTTWTAVGGILRTSDYSPLPSEPFTITYVVGRPDLPANIRRAALEILRTAWASQRASEPPPFLISYRAQAWLAPDEQFGMA